MSPSSEIKIIDEVERIDAKKKRRKQLQDTRMYKKDKNPLSFYQIFPHLPALISQRGMRFRIGFQARPYGQVLLIGYTVKKILSE